MSKFTFIFVKLGKVDLSLGDLFGINVLNVSTEGHSLETLNKVVAIDLAEVV